MKNFIVKKNENGIKLDSFLKMHINASFNFLMMMERKKIVKVNGVHPKDFKMILKENDDIKIYLNDDLFKDENITTPFDIIYEDKNILIIDKKKGLIVHSDKKNDHNTLIDQITKYLIDKHEYIPSVKESFRPAIITRLDYNTEGLVVACKNKESINSLNKLFEENKISKIYRCICIGVPNINNQLLKDYLIINEELNMVTISKENKENAKEIITEYELIDSNDNLSLLEITLHTGRLHQIRAHMSYYGLPVLGDNKYGNKKINDKYKIKTQMLISYRLEFKEIKDNMFEYLSNKVFLSKIKVKYLNEL